MLSVNSFIELIGANSKAISNAEDRKKFRKNMLDIGLDLPKSKVINHYNWGKKRLAYPIDKQKYGSDPKK